MIPPEANNGPDPQQIARMRDAAMLASQGKFRCQGCAQVHPVENGIMVAWAGNIILGVCPGCLTDHQVTITRVGEGIEIKASKKSQIVLASSLAGVPQPRLVNPNLKKREF